MLILASGLSFGAKPKKPAPKPVAPKVVATPFDDVFAAIDALDQSVLDADAKIATIKNATLALDNKIQALGVMKIRMLDAGPKRQINLACSKLRNAVNALHKEYSGMSYYIPQCLQPSDIVLKELNDMQANIQKCYDKVHGVYFYQKPWRLANKYPKSAAIAIFIGYRLLSEMNNAAQVVGLGKSAAQGCNLAKRVLLGSW